MRVTGDGQVVPQLRHRWIDGTTHVVFDPRGPGTAGGPRAAAAHHLDSVPRRAWASLMVHTFGFDVLACPRSACIAGADVEDAEKLLKELRKALK